MHRPHLFPELWEASTGSPGFLSFWMALPYHCNPRATCGGLSGQQQAIPTLSPLVLLPVYLDGWLCPASMRPGPGMAIWLVSTRWWCPGLCGAHVGYEEPTTIDLIYSMSGGLSPLILLSFSLSALLLCT